MHTILSETLPADLGMPDKFDHYRDIQGDACEYVMEQMVERDRIAVGLPPGAGKTLIAQTLIALTGRRGVVLTATKTLQDQVCRDRFDIVDIRGKATFKCSSPNKYENCEVGDEEGCGRYGTSTCGYSNQLIQGNRSDSILSNYFWWMSARSVQGQVLQAQNPRPISLLILDEAHLAPMQLAKFLGTYVSQKDLARFGNGQQVKYAVRLAGGESWARVDEAWILALTEILARIEVRMSGLAEKYDTLIECRRSEPEYRRLDRLSNNLGRLTQLGTDGNWIWRHTTNGTGIAFDCVWPFRYAERYLFCGVEKVVLMSATLRPKALRLLGLKTKGTGKEICAFREWPRVFPAHLTPVYYWPQARTGRKSTEEDFAKIARAVDDICISRSDRKVIIHVPSYKLAERLQGACRVGRWMLLSKPASYGVESNATEIARRFREAKAPSVLISPSFMTGHDFPNEQAEVVIIPKLPFANLGEPVEIARGESDKGYSVYEMLQQVVQGSGRATRHETDRSEVFILDKGWKYQAMSGKEHLPGWFRWREVNKLPGCPARARDVR